MSNLETTGKRIIGVRTRPAGVILFCEAGALSPDLGDWVMVECEALTFPAQVVLPGSLVESTQLSESLPVLLRMAGKADLAAAGYAFALEAQAARRFKDLAAAHNLPFLLKEVGFNPDRLLIRFSAGQEPTAPDYVLLLEGLAETFQARVELFLVSEDAATLKPPVGENFGGWVNGLLVELDPAIMSGATVGAPLLDRAAVYRPGQRLISSSAPALPSAAYDPATATFSVGGTTLDLPNRGDN